MTRLLRRRAGAATWPRVRDYLVYLPTILIGLIALGAVPASGQIGDQDRQATQTVLGRIIDLTLLQAQGGTPASYAAKVVPSLDAKKAAVGGDPEQWKWQGGAAAYGAGVATGDASDIQTGDEVARRYAQYVIQAGGGAPEPYVKPQCLAVLFLRTGDPSALQALGLLADNYCRRFYRLITLGAAAETDELSGRLLTWYILAPGLAHLCGAPQGTNPFTGERWDHAAIARAAYDYALRTQGADGYLTIRDTPYYQWGMLTSAAVWYARTYGDSRALGFCSRALAWLFANVWFDGTFYYSSENHELAVDDNGFFAQAAAYVASQGDPRGAAWFDALLEGCVSRARWAGWQEDTQLAFLWAFPDRLGQLRNVGVTPAQATVAVGAATTLTSTHVNPAGGARIARVYLMVSDQSYANLFRAMYSAQLDRLYVADASGTWQGGVAPGVATNIPSENGKLNCGGVGVSRPDAQTLQVGWNITLPARYAGQTLRVSLYMETDDGRSAGWDALGSIAVTSQASEPHNVGVSPAQTTVAAGAATTLTSTHVNPAGGARIARVYLMVSDQSYANLFRAMYSAQLDRLYVADASGTWQGGVAPGVATNIPSENGTLNCGGVGVSRPDAQTLQVGWNITLPARFAGQTLPVSLYMETDDGRSAGWNALGSIAVAPG